MPSTTVADVLSGLQSEPGRPRLTWYGPQGERIELSGAVLENWVTKTTNLLVEELDVGPGTHVVLDLPAHWRSVVWALATWRAGACVVLPAAGPPQPGFVAVTDAPGGWSDADTVVAVTLPALARRFDGPLPDRAIDAASAVMTYGDVLGWVPAVEPGAPALSGPNDTVLHRDLLMWALDVPGGRGERALVTTPSPEPRADACARLLRASLGVLQAGGSLVVLDASTTLETDSDAPRRARLLATERVTMDLGPAL